MKTAYRLRALLLVGLAVGRTLPANADLEAIRNDLYDAWRQRVEADSERAPALDLSLNLDRGPMGRPLRMTLRRRGETWHVGEVTALRGGVEVSDMDASGLIAAAGSLRGTLRIRWAPEAVPGWQDRRPGARLADGDAWEQTYALEEAGAEGKDGLTGAYLSSGSRGTWRGTFTATVHSAWVPAGLPEVEETDPALRAAELAGQIRGLALALRAYPMDLDRALDLVGVTAPADPSAAGLLAALTAWASLAAQEPPTAPPPVPESFGPFFGRAAESGWERPDGWEVIGPFSAPSVTDDLGIPPRLAPEAATGWLRTRTLSGGARDSAETVEDTAPWMAAARAETEIRLPPVPETAAGRMRDFDWYARSTIRREAAGPVWLGLRVRDEGAVWVNRRLVWTSALRPNPVDTAVIPVDLDAGENHVLVRVRGTMDGAGRHLGQIDWFEGWREDKPRGAADLTGFDLAFSTQAPAPKSGPLPQSGAAPPPVRVPDADPPLAFDLDQGVNVAWSTPLTRGVGAPVLHDGLLYVTSEPDRIQAVDAATGAVRWTWAAHPDSDISTEGFRARHPPVVTADRVLVAFGTGVAAALHPATGDLLWRTDVPEWNHPNLGPAQWAAPENLFLVMDEVRVRRGQSGPQGFRITALNAATGALRWTAGPDPEFGPGIAVATFGDRSVVVTSEGCLLDARTGEVAHRGLTRIEHVKAPPVAEDGVALFTSFIGQEAVRIWVDEAGRIGARHLWQARRVAGRGQARTVDQYGPSHWFREPLVDGGRFYLMRYDTAHVPQHYPLPWIQLDTYDAEDGAYLHRVRALFREALHPAVPPARIGPYLLTLDAGRPVPGFHATTEYAQIGWVNPDPVPHLVARQRIPHIRAAPAADAERLYLRFEDRLVALARTEAGRELERRLLVDTVFTEVGDRPQLRDLPTLTPWDGFELGDGDAVTRLEGGFFRGSWLAVGPFPADGPEQPPDLAAATRPRAGAAPAEGWPEARRLDPRFLRDGHGLDVMAVAEGSPRTRWWYFTVLDAREEQVLRLSQRSSGVEMWMGGRAMADGDEVRVPIGPVPVWIRVDLFRLPGFMRNLVVAPTFRILEDPEQAVAAWTDRIRIYQHELGLIAEAADTREGRMAATWLKEIQE